MALFSCSASHSRTIDFFPLAMIRNPAIERALD
jgi:hypothetical protein